MNESYYKMKCSVYATLAGVIYNGIKFKSHNSYKHGKISRMVQSFYNKPSIEKEEKIIQYLKKIEDEEGKKFDLGDTYELSRRIEDVYSRCGDAISPSDAYSQAARFRRDPISSLEGLLDSFMSAKESMINRERLEKKETKAAKRVKKNEEDDEPVRTTRSAYNGAYKKSSYRGIVSDDEEEKREKKEKYIKTVDDLKKELDSTDMSRLEKSEAIFNSRKDYSTYSVKDGIVKIFDEDTYDTKNNIKKQIDFMLAVEDVRTGLYNIDHLNELAERTIEAMVSYAEYQASREATFDAEMFLTKSGFGNNLEVYKKYYEKYMKKYGKRLTEEQKKQIMTPEEVRREINRQRREKMTHYLNSSAYSKSIDIVSIFTSLMDEDEIAKAYELYCKNNLFPSLDYYEEAKDKIQEAFAYAILTRMNPIPEGEEYTDEYYRRMSAICHDYFFEIPSHSSDPDGKYKSMEYGYAKKQVEDHKLIQEKKAIYYNKPLFERAFNSMNFSRLKELERKVNLTDEDREEIKRMM